MVKKNGQRVAFDRDKLRARSRACRKRPVDPERVERMVTGIVRRLESMGENEMPSTQIGELVMEALARSIRSPMCASPRSTNFRETQDFEEFIADLAETATSRTDAMMRAALALARRSLGRTWPNPAVGCVIVTDGASSAAAAPRTAAGRMPRSMRWPGRRRGARRHGLCHARALLAFRQVRRPAPMPWSRPAWRGSCRRWRIPTRR